ncbi:MAG: putative Fe-Mo cluster-binding NifX family protein [Desulforhopalus sp.]|jgi:predicted Fe-Mo cluster-binding NifX family protein
MNIAITVDGDLMTSPVSEQFERCTNLLIVNVDTAQVTTIYNPKESDEIAGDRLAQKVLEYDCEAVITGLIRSTAFEVLAGACVTRFLGIGHNAGPALELMDSNSLDLIRDADGGTGCGGSHHH